MTQPSFSSGAGPGLKLSGCPDRNRAWSRSGPWGPILDGGWQSEHPIAFTRYRPRVTRSIPFRAGAEDSAACDSPHAHKATDPTTARNAAAIIRVIFRSFQFWLEETQTACHAGSLGETGPDPW